MNLKGRKIGVAITGSFCMFSKTIDVLKGLKKEEANIIPIMSFNGYSLDTRFGSSANYVSEIQEICENKVLNKIQEVEPIGPKKMTDIMLVMPCTGNTIAKLAAGITDTPVTMAVKSHLRNSNPVVIAISTNDALAAAAENIGKLLNRKNYYFVPFRQDNPITKPTSILFDEKYVIKTLEDALEYKQIQPVIL